MQKTFDVWVKAKPYDAFIICSKVINTLDGLEEIDIDANEVEDGSDVSGCDVSQWLETLGLEHGEVIEAKVTFKID